MASVRPEARIAARASVLALVGALWTVGCVPAPRTFVARHERPFVRVDSLTSPFRIAVLPLANYSTDRDAVQRISLALLNECARIPGIEIVDPGAVDTALSKEPWTLLDRLPPDLADRIGAELKADGLLQGALLQYGVREGSDGRTPQVSMALRLTRCPGSRIVWSAVHGRDGADGEWLFGFGRVNAMEQLATAVVREAVKPFATAMEEEDKRQRKVERK